MISYGKCYLLSPDSTAPEMRWPYPNKKYTWREQPMYDEKTDIWKFQELCEYFFSLLSNNTFPNQLLDDIHERCKNTDPDQRPTAEEVLQEYRQVMQLL
jgi:glycoprotein-mannosyl O6-kinase